MAVEILMPELGESVHEGTVSRWLKKEGESVKEDEPIVEIMTDKVNTELPSPATGILKKILIPVGESVQVFAVMGVIDDKGDMNEILTSSIKTEDKAVVEKKILPENIEVASMKEENEKRNWFTPVVRAIAKDHDIFDYQLNQIKGSGIDGRVTKKDIEEYIHKETSTLNPIPLIASPTLSDRVEIDQEKIPFVGMRKMIAEAMIKSSQVPTVSTLVEVDVTRLVNFRTQNKEIFQSQFGVRLTYTPFFIKILSECLMEFPMINASLQGDTIDLNNAVHLGVAVALGTKGDQGLIVPIIRNVHQKTLVEIAKDLEQITTKARNNGLGISDVQGGTFTLTNPGTYGAISGTPMINAPQAAILGVYSIKKIPVVIEDMIAIRSVMNVVLTYDHRIIDGALAGRFLQTVKSKLESFDFFK